MTKLRQKANECYASEISKHKFQKVKLKLKQPTKCAMDFFLLSFNSKLIRFQSMSTKNTQRTREKKIGFSFLLGILNGSFASIWGEIVIGIFDVMEIFNGKRCTYVS